jgi:hypothetical protein
MKSEEFFAWDEARAASRGEALLALWCEARGDWARAHDLAQAAGEARDREAARAGAWVHAYLHRAEGDEGNAGYWYARAGRRAPTRGTSFAAERAAIAVGLLAER